MMTAPINLAETRRDQRRVAALFNASRQLDIVVPPPYHVVPYDTQLKHGRAASPPSHLTGVTAPIPTRISEPQLYHRKDRQSKQGDEWENRPLRFSAPSVPFLSGGYPSFNQIHARQSEHDSSNLNFSYPPARVRDAYIGSWQNKDPVDKKIYPKRQQRPDNTFKAWPKLDIPRPKHKKPSFDEPKPHRQRKRSTHQIADFRLPNPKKSEQVPTRKPPQPSDYGGMPTNRRRCDNTAPAVVKYTHDVVDLSLQTGVNILNEFISEPKSKIVSKPTSRQVEDKVETRQSNTDQLERRYSVLSQFHRKPSSIAPSEVPDQPDKDEKSTSEYSEDPSNDESDNEMDESGSVKESEAEESDSDEDMYDFDLDNSALHRHDCHNRSLPDDSTSDPWGRAYVDALAKARQRNMPLDLEEFNHRMTRPYTFSYFANHRSSCKCAQCLRSALSKSIRKKKGKKKSKAPSGMKTILGKVKMYDYFHFKTHSLNS